MGAWEVEAMLLIARSMSVFFYCVICQNFTSPICVTKEGPMEKTLPNTDSHILNVCIIKPPTCRWSLISAISWGDFQVTKDSVCPQQTSAEFWLTAEGRIETHFEFLSDIISVETWNVPASGKKRCDFYLQNPSQTRRFSPSFSSAHLSCDPFLNLLILCSWWDPSPILKHLPLSSRWWRKS